MSETDAVSKDISSCMYSSLPNQPLFQSLRQAFRDDANNGKGVWKMLFK